ncbi:hypothetical protein GCM10010461_15870 [Microbacterium aurantiacum]
MDLWSFIAWFFWIFVFAAYLMVVFSIIAEFDALKAKALA